MSLAASPLLLPSNVANMIPRTHVYGRDGALQMTQLTGGTSGKWTSSGRRGWSAPGVKSAGGGSCEPTPLISGPVQARVTCSLSPNPGFTKPWRTRNPGAAQGVVKSLRGFFLLSRFIRGEKIPF